MIKTSRLFWDCECTGNNEYIHSKKQTKCLKCGTFHFEQPDSRPEEIRLYLSTLTLKS